MPGLLQRLNQVELPICLFFNHINHTRLISQFFGIISRLGNGGFWYSFIIILPLVHGSQAIIALLHIIIAALIVTIIYKSIKSTTLRVRPYKISSNILQNVAALDQFSFPSGHTMYAVSFSYILIQYYPQWGWVVVPFTILVSLSRLVLGLHYPSDVLAGIILGLLIGQFSFNVVITQATNLLLSIS